MLADSYPFWSLMWTMIVFFVWILWFWLLFVVLADVFRRHDISGWGKTGWIVFVVILPFLGVFIYLITQNDGMNDRRQKDMQTQQAQVDDYVRKTAGTGGAAGEIEKGKALLDSGAITQAEFDAIKQKALA